MTEGFGNIWEPAQISDAQLNGKLKQIKDLAQKEWTRSHTASGGRLGPVPPTNEAVSNAMGGLEHTFVHFQYLMVDKPWDFDPYINTMKEAHTYLSNATAHSQMVQQANSIDDEFTGYTSNVFFQNYIAHHMTIHGNQVQSIEKLAQILQVNKKILSLQRDALDKAADQTIKQLKALSGISGYNALKIGIAIVGLVAAVFSAGTSVAGAAAAESAIGIAQASAGGAIASAIVTGAGTGTAIKDAADQSELKDQTIHGSDVEGVIASLGKVLQTIEDERKRAENALAAGVRSARGELYKLWKGVTVDKFKNDKNQHDGSGKPISLMVVPRPAIADAPRSVLTSRAKLKSTGLLMIDEKG